MLALVQTYRPHRKTGVAPMDLVTTRRQRNFSLERMQDGMTPDASQLVVEVKDAFLKTLKAFLPQVRVSIFKTKAQ